MSEHGPTLSRAEVIGLLTELGAVLHRDGLHATIYVVGGAAMSITLDSRRVTRDVDAVFRTETDGLRTAAREVAARHGLDPEWLNDRVTSAVVGLVSDEGQTELDVPGLSAAVASPEHLLAMKMLAGRERDLDDLVVLFRHLGITAPCQAVEITERVFGGGHPDSAPPLEYLELLAEDVLDRLGI
ncbi:DUF6036 family nucleotidyltransferase [Cellulomonas algicola]|uniref:DUF6036 family nucleotidyltransferase n=1 Tax=Cellulomonas algicola TaxID=2071633 RepID=UPI001C3FE933|nr:DUF6036 family nucleotidyltransferase [Cellulomonas algicola]